MKTLSALLSAALGAPVQRPAVLVEVHFAAVQRWSSMSSVNWNGHTWAARDVAVENLSVQPFKVSGELVLGNLDDAAGALVLAQGVKDRRIVVYGYDAAALTDVADAVWLCTAVGGPATVDTREVRIGLRHRTEYVQSPRGYVDAASGFTQMLPANTVLRINGIDYRLER